MRRQIVLIGAVVGFAVLAMASCNLMEIVNSDSVVRVQYPWGGVTWYCNANGPKPQLLGRVEVYAKRGTVQFQPAERADSGNDERLSVDFNDRGTGTIQGSINYELPCDENKLNGMYSNFPSQTALEDTLIKPAVNSSIYLTGQLMSSFESYSTRKSELVAYVEDQAQRGLYQTQSQQVEVPDEIDPTKKTTVTRSSIVANNNPSQLNRARTGGGEVDRYGIRVFQFAIENLTYDATVNDQIKQQQGITMAVQTSRARALEAAQNALTAVEQGKEKVAIAEAAQREINAKNVEAAIGQRRVAEENAKKAAEEKAAAILLAQGEAEANRLKVVSGLSPQERATFELEKQKAWANAMANSQQPLVPSMVVGGGSGANAMTGWQAAMEAVGLTALRDLGAQRGSPQSRVAPAVAPAQATPQTVPTAGRGRGAAPQQAQR